jgi:gas vesicle protein
MKNEEFCMSAKNYWFAFGIGVTAGATIALLYAPQKGVVTRKRLRKSVDEASDYLEDAGDYLKDQAERLSKEAENIIKRTRSQVESVVDSASSSMAGAVKTAKSLL